MGWAIQASSVLSEQAGQIKIASQLRYRCVSGIV